MRQEFLLMTNKWLGAVMNRPWLLTQLGVKRRLLGLMLACKASAFIRFSSRRKPLEVAKMDLCKATWKKTFTTHCQWRVSTRITSRLWPSVPRDSIRARAQPSLWIILVVQVSNSWLNLSNQKSSEAPFRSGKQRRAATHFWSKHKDRRRRCLNPCKNYEDHSILLGFKRFLIKSLIDEKEGS